MTRLLEHIEEVARMDSVYPNEKVVREYIVKELENFGRKVRLDESDNLYLYPRESSRVLLSAHMDKFCPPEDPYWINDGIYIKGQLDDAIGVGIILDLAEKYDFYALFTVSEEGGLDGSAAAIEDPDFLNLAKNIKYAIVVDVSSVDVGNAPFLYTYRQYGPNIPSKDFIDKIVELSKDISPKPHITIGRSNDGENIIQVIDNTIALEPYVKDPHTSYGKCLIQDIINVHNIIKKFLEYAAI